MRRKITLRACCLLFLVLFFITVSIDDLLSQDRPSPPSSEQIKKDNTKSDPIKELEGKAKSWIKNPILILIIWGIIAPILAYIFKDLIKKMITEGLRPLLGRLVTRLFILFGRYRALLKRYQRTLQRRLREGGLTRQLIGEGVDLEKNYIPIQISKEEYKNPEFVPSFEPTDDRKADKTRSGVEPSRRERIEVNEALSNERDYGNRIAIIGDPGSGKTTLMQHLAYQCAKNEGVKLIPALVTLTDYVRSGARDVRSYLSTVFEENAFPKAQDYLEAQLEAGKLLILLDGFDEVEMGKRESVRKQIEAFANNEEYVQSKFVVTSRPIRDAVFDNFRHLEVMPLLAEHRRLFLESKVDDSPGSEFDSRKCAELINAIEGHDRIRKLASNALLLTFLYYVYKYNLELPRRRVELYRQSINLMLDWDVKTGRPTHIKVRDRDAKKEMLKRVAYHYHTNRVSQLPREELIEQVDKYLPGSLKEDFTAEALIEEIENSSSIVRHSNDILVDAYGYRGTSQAPLPGAAGDR
jgi:predicted NACHT family NTPase